MEDWEIDFGLGNNEKDDVTKEIYHVTALVGQYAAKQLCKMPRRSSEQTGHAWVTTRMGIEEMVAMFLNMVGHAQGEDMVELDDDHGSLDPSVRLTVASSTEMDLVRDSIRDSIRDQIVEHMKLN
ncbi:hypothetical protein V6N13_039036 [Hibiscus sabdariffa]